MDTDDLKFFALVGAAGLVASTGVGAAVYLRENIVNSRPYTPVVVPPKDAGAKLIDWSREQRAARIRQILRDPGDEYFVSELKSAGNDAPELAGLYVDLIDDLDPGNRKFTTPYDLTGYRNYDYGRVDGFTPTDSGPARCILLEIAAFQKAHNLTPVDEPDHPLSEMNREIIGQVADQAMERDGVYRPVDSWDCGR